MLHSIAKFCFHHFVVVIVFWMLVLAGTLGASASLGSNWMEQGSLKGTESAKANDLLNKELPEQASGAGGGTGHIVFHSTDKILTHKVAIEKYLNKFNFYNNTLTKIQLGYTINTAYNFNVSLGYNYRYQDFLGFNASNNRTTFYTISLKSNLFNTY